MSGKQIKLFLVNGTPGSLTTAEITNWTGHVLSGRRSDLSDVVQREEAQRTGVYFLLGEDETAVENTRCYIGEADVVAECLRIHNRNKDFWDRVVVITSKDTNLTKSHGRYLESRLIQLAHQAGRATLENSTAPPAPGLPEADTSDMNYFISQLQIVLPVLGVNTIRVRETARLNEAPSKVVASPVFSLTQARMGVDARAQQIDGEFTVLKGSTLVPSWRGTGKAASTIKSYASYRNQHERLLADGAFRLENGTAVTTRDIVFSSPSTAGAVLLGRSCNGRREWVYPRGTFGTWESGDVT